MHDQPNVYCDNEQVLTCARLVIALDELDDLLTHYMGDDAWDAYEEVQAATIAARDALIGTGYAHLLAGHVA